MGAASINYLYHGNYPLSLYWLAGLILNIAVLWSSVK